VENLSRAVALFTSWTRPRAGGTAALDRDVLG